MQSIIKHIFIYLVSYGANSLYAQVDYQPSQHALKMDFKLPSAFGNRAFKAVMNGIVDLDFAYQYHFPKSNLIVNAGFKYGLWKVETTFFGGVLLEGKLQTYTPFIGLGYRSKISESVFMELELKAGYSGISSKADQCSENFNQSGFSVEPKLNIYLKASDLLYFGANLNYHLIGAEFSESNICVADFPGLNSAASKGSYSYLSIGLGFYAYLPKLKG